MTAGKTGVEMVGKMSLQDFATAHPGPGNGPHAWLTTIPEFETICQAWQSGAATQPQIRDWLIEVQGYSAQDCTPSKIAWLTIYLPKRANG